MSQIQKAVKDPSLEPAGALELVARMDSVTGLGLLKSAQDALQNAKAVLSTADGSHEGDSEAAEIDALVAGRQKAKAEKDFARADEIRRELAERGITLTDTPNGPVWKRN